MLRSNNRLHTRRHKHLHKFNVHVVNTLNIINLASSSGFVLTGNLKKQEVFSVWSAASCWLLQELHRKHLKHEACGWTHTLQHKLLFNLNSVRKHTSIFKNSSVQCDSPFCVCAQRFRSAGRWKVTRAVCSVCARWGAALYWPEEEKTEKSFCGTTNCELTATSRSHTHTRHAHTHTHTHTHTSEAACCNFSQKCSK